jgi:hypothetical protein
MITVMKSAAVASVLLLAAGSTAGAQSYTANSSTRSNPNSDAQSALSQSSAGAGITADTQQKIRQSLEQSGFKDVRVTPESFVVRTQAPDGSHIVMLLNPDKVTGVVVGAGSPSMQGTGSSQSLEQASSQTGYGTTQTTSQQQAQQDLSRYGYTSFQNLRPMQGWSADATKNGENVHVMLTDNGLVATFPGR